MDGVVEAVVRHPAQERARSFVTLLALLALLAAGIVGGDPAGIRERLFAGTSPDATAAPSQPWQGVVTLQGTGTTTAAPFSIARDTVEWRVKWSCQSGHLFLQGAGTPRPLVDAACPGTGAGFGSRTGTNTLQVTADGPWQLDIEQRIDPGRAPRSRM